MPNAFAKYGQGRMFSCNMDANMAPLLLQLHTTIYVQDSSMKFYWTQVLLTVGTFNHAVITDWGLMLDHGDPLLQEPY